MESGQMLAHYKIAESIGKGGMGEVFRARDTKLDRDVALKILPPEFAADADRLARFKREAKVLASLHHPNIASIFGFESEGERPFLVMELVEGEDLSELLKRGPVPVDDAVDIARQIAEGLEEAHEKGIVHRDLKPANVKRTPDGKVKVLDFGLARAYAGETAGEEAVSSAPTMTAAMTQVGTVMGTAAYMSPEQARGKEVDRRADIWAFGVILFEMLTGKQLFLGETASDTLAGILKSEPEWDDLPTGLPFQLDRVLRRCLAKDPRQRLRDIGEARVRLEDPEAESGLFSGPIHAVTDISASSRSRQVLPWALLAISLLAVGWLQWRPAVDHLEGALYVAMPAPENADFHLSGSYPGPPEISPDGKRVAFSGNDRENHTIQLYVRALADEEAVVLGDTKEAQYPFWSADGNWVGYYARNEGLMKVPVNGGPPQLICAAGNGKGGAWNATDDILLTTDYNTSIFTVKATGGEPRAVTDLANDKGFNSHRHPQFMPDGRHFIYFARGAGKSSAEIRFASLDDTTHTVVTNSKLMGYYASGHLLHVTHGNLVAQPFDPGTGVLSGAPTPLVQDVQAISGAAKGAFSVSTEGTLTYLRGNATLQSTLTWRDRDNKEIVPVGDTAAYDLVSLAPDGRSAAVGIIEEQAGTWDIWIMDLARNFMTRFTTDVADDFDLVWSRDSRSLYFASDRGDGISVYHKEIGSPNPPVKIMDGGAAFRLWDISADGQTIFYSSAGDNSGLDLWAASLDGATEPQLVRGTPEHDYLAQLSPDGRWLVFCSVESGEPQVYVAPWPAMAPLTQVSTTTGYWSAWTKDGSELVYQEISGRLMAAPMTVEDDRMMIGQSEPLFDFTVPAIDGIQWSIAADGEKLLTVNTHDLKAPGYCNLVLNWPALVAKQ